MRTQGMEQIRQKVRESYGRIGASGTVGCGCNCGGSDEATAATEIGYASEDLTAVPAGANLGLGCGNPRGIASLQEGETVVDLGSGGGFDCLLAAKEVGEGRVIGIDMTPAMIDRARANAVKAGAENVEFRLGEIENLPVADASADAIISNCVINLSPEKERVFAEAFRILQKGGRLAIADVVATGPIPGEVKEDPAMHAGCVSGAVEPGELQSVMESAGFVDVEIRLEESFQSNDTGRFVASAAIRARKP